MNANVAGFDWDEGNREKCQRHGVSVKEIEELFKLPLLIVPDATHSQSEERLRAIGTTVKGRFVFLIFTIREIDGKRFVRPIRARYLHKKEVAHYEKENPGI